MKKQITIKKGKKEINLIADDCDSFRKFSGLMFSRREQAEILLFEFKKKQRIAIHSFFVFYPFLAIWLNENNEIVEMKNVAPFQPCVSSTKLASKLIEVPINSKNNKILSLLSSPNPTHCI